MRNPNTNTNQKQFVGTNLLTKPMIFQYTQTSDDSIPIQTIHIKQPKTKFQIYKLCIPRKCLQQNNKLFTKPGITH